MQAQDIIYAALREAGVLNPGQAATAEEMADCLNRLNRMLASWSVRRLYIYALNQAAYTLTANQQSYTIGPTGNFATTRPLAIRNANIVTATEGAYFPLKIVSAEEFSREPERATRKGNIPLLLYYDGQYPLGTLSLFPTPNQAATLELFSWQQLSQFALLSTTFDMPPGYEIAVILKLAVWLGPMFGKPTPPALAADAEDAVAAIRSLNPPPHAGAASELQASGLAQPIPPNPAEALAK